MKQTLLRGFMVEVKVVSPKRNWVQTWWQSLNSLSRLLVIALSCTTYSSECLGIIGNFWLF
ncbi:MAG UNVERIFIED_CONTAM: hypothetical protein LVR29_07085 [Microcystis novacekii LVE1205-3]